jgi:hypothetical protein
MNDAIRLSNKAIEMLSQSSDETHMQEAIGVFTQSLRGLKAILVEQEAPKKNNDDDDDDDSSSLDESSSSSEASGCSLAAVIDCPCEAQHPHCPDTAESNFVYKRMFRLFASTSKTAPNAIQTYISCVIFNLALLHQHQASSLELGALRTYVLEKSALLYKACFQILVNIVPSNNKQKKTSSSSASAPFDDVTFLLKVGALNNSAQILYESDQFEQAYDRLEMVESILCSQELSVTKCCFTVQEFEGILSNVLLLKPRPTVAVAA